MNIRDSFEGWAREDVLAFLKENNYLMARQLPGGEWVAMVRLAFTWSICTDVTPYTPFNYRWCFEDKAEAVYFLKTMKEYDEVPEHKSSLRGHRYRTTPLLFEKDEHGFDKW